MSQPTWVIQGKRESFTFPEKEFATKREAMRAMEVDREPKTPIVRLTPHYYVFAMRKQR